MNKTAIKVIKRKDAAAGSFEAQTPPGQKGVSGEKIEPRARRKMAETVSNWIAERRENKRSEEISAFRKLFGDEFLSGRTA